MCVWLKVRVPIHVWLLGVGSRDFPPQVEESTQLHCFLSKESKNHSFCVELSEVSKFVIEKKIWFRKRPKKWFEELSLQRFFIFGLNYHWGFSKKIRKNRKNFPKNRKTFFSSIVIKTVVQRESILNSLSSHSVRNCWPVIWLWTL